MGMMAPIQTVRIWVTSKSYAVYYVHLFKDNEYEERLEEHRALHYPTD